MAYLKEFDLSISNIDKKISRKFELQTRCVTAQFARLFPKFKNQNCWKVDFECVDKIEKEMYRDLLGVYVLEVEVNTDLFFSYSTDQQKKVWTYDVLKSGIEKLLTQTGWPASAFHETLLVISDLNLENKWVWRKPKYSPSRKLTAEVLIEHGVKICDISIVIRDRNGEEVTKKLLTSNQPSEWDYARHLGSLCWENKNKVVLTNKAGDQQWSVEV